MKIDNIVNLQYYSSIKKGGNNIITAKELQYVDLWASKIPMPGIEYSSNVMKEIEECYHIYKKYILIRNMILYLVMAKR